MSRYSREAALATLDPLLIGPIDLDDLATRLVVFALLAHRVGLDPSWGVTWSHLGGPRGWVLAVTMGSSDISQPWTRQFVPRCETGCCVVVPGLTTSDPEEALLRALWATRPKETP